METPAHEFALMAVIGPVLNAIAFVLAMSLVREPARQRFNAILVAGAGAAYLNGGLGLGVSVHRRGDGGRLPRAFVLSLDRRRVAAAHRLGHRSPSLRQSDLALDASLVGRAAQCSTVSIAVWFLLGAPSVYAIRRRGPDRALSATR